MRSGMGLGEKKDHDLTPTGLRETKKPERKARVQRAEEVKPRG